MPAAPVPEASSRRRTRETGVFVRDSPGSRSLERGLALLRAFRPGTVALGNAELARRTGLPRATVSRLSRSLVEAGFLEYHVPSSSYRLGPPFLAFGQAVREGSVVLRTALPLMREMADGLTINVGLAVADVDEMVYLESVRKSRLGLFRHVASGSRLPVAESALGRAWLAGLAPEARADALRRLAPRHGERWPQVLRDVERSLEDVERRGWCGMAWRSGLVSIATPLAVPGLPVHAFNISFPAADGERRARDETRYAPLLMATRARILEALARVLDAG
ncbi:MAG TPA: IclR family transcriptional regulator [Burkholderiaceae bacterium]|nr:IclR family transcriptional regulator [Burkholderiaceae bacterium]